MGLDQYLVRVPEGVEIDSKECKEVEIAYWRKFNELQGYFERNYNQSNCGYTKLGKIDILYLLDILKSPKKRKENLTQTEGFFYGRWDYTKDDIKYTKKVLNEALEYIEMGYAVYYTCWY